MAITQKVENLEATHFTNNKVINQEEKIFGYTVGIIFRTFFKEILLIKLGAIIIFIGVVFLISLVGNILNDIIKVMMVFTIGFFYLFYRHFPGKEKVYRESKSSNISLNTYEFSCYSCGKICALGFIKELSITITSIFLL